MTFTHSVQQNLPPQCTASQQTSPLSTHQFDVRQVSLPAPKDRTTEALDLATGSRPDKNTHESLEHIDRATQLNNKAKENGIVLAKKEFFKALFNVSLAGLGLGLSIAATALTSGTGIPVLAASGVAFALVISDAGCAYADWRSKAGGHDGLKMGSDTLANAVNAMLDNMGMNSKNSIIWANSTSVALRTTLMLTTLFCSVTSAAKVPGTIGCTLSMMKLGKSVTKKIAGMGIDVGISSQKKQISKLKIDKSNNTLFDLHLDKVQTQIKLESMIHHLVKTGGVTSAAASMLLEANRYSASKVTNAV